MITATINKAVKKFIIALTLFIVLLPEILFPKFLYKFINLFYICQLMPQKDSGKNFAMVTDEQQKKGRNKQDRSC